MSEIENILKTKIQANDAQTFLVIVPNDAARQKRERELIEYHPDGAVTDLQVVQINRFIQRLYRQARQSRTDIPSGIQRLWLHEIARLDNSGKDKYHAFRPNQNIEIPDSTLSLIAETINNLRERDDTELNFVEDNQTQADLESIYKNYNDKLGSQWIDEQGKNLFLAENFREDYLKSAFPHVDLIVVEGFAVLSNTNIKLLKQIAKIDRIQMWFRTDCIKTNENLYQNTTNLVRHFEDVGVNIDSEYERKPKIHQYYAENLFKKNNTTPDKIDLSEKIKLLTPSDRSEEVEQIAHLIQTLVSNGECNLSDICVTYYNIAKYQQRIAETFSDYGIPYALSERMPLTKSEVVKQIFSRLASNQNSHGFAYFSNEQTKLEKKQYHPNEFLECVNDILNESDTLKNILNPMWHANSKVVEGEINALQSFKRILKELCSVLELEEDKPYPIHAFVWQLRYIAKHTFYQPRTSRKSETVKIQPLGELRSSEFDYVFLGDFVDGGFPYPYRSDPLLPETPYRTEDEHIHDNRFLFYRVLKSFRKKLFLLTPDRDREAKLIPSIFKEQLEEIVQIGTEEIADVGGRSRTGFLSSYGDYVWNRDKQIEIEFPSNVDNMRPLIDHVVSVEKRRENKDDRSQYSGFLEIEDLSTEAQRVLQRMQTETYSVTDLETYANCPYQYFMKNVMKTKVAEDDDDGEISRQEKGNLAHNTLFKFYKDHKEKKNPPLSQVSQEDFEASRKQLHSLLKQVSEEKRQEQNISENNLFWSVSTDKLRASLFRWIEAEKLYDLTVLPRYFEVKFGRSPGDSDPELSSTDPIPINDVNMQGKIDRIDIGKGYFNIIDYKTGSSTLRKADILCGRSLQLPIYLQIASKLLDKKGKTGLESAAGLYHKVRLNECTVELGLAKTSLNETAFKTYRSNNWKKAYSSEQLLDDENFDSILERVNGYIRQFVDSIAEGIFPIITRVDTYVNSKEEGEEPITPKNPTKPCSYCNYKRLCRVRPFEQEYQQEN